MEEDGLSVDNLFRQCVFRKDERDMVLKALHIVQPDYQPSLNASTSQYTSSLVQHFYTQVYHLYHTIAVIVIRYSDVLLVDLKALTACFLYQLLTMGDGLLHEDTIFYQCLNC